MKELVPRTLDWIDDAPVRVRVSRRIDAPRERVWAAVADHAGWSDWFGAISKVEPGDPPHGVGGQRRVHLGRIRFDEEFLAWDEGSRFAFCVTAASVRVMRSVVEDVQLSSTHDGRTTVTYVQAVDPIGGSVAAAVLRRGLPRALSGALDDLATHVGA